MHRRMPDVKAKTTLKNKIPVVIDYAATVMDRTLGVTLSHEGTKPSANAIAPFLSLQMWHVSGTRLTRAER
ncbi:hypothetical protein L915_19634 [Phytophthora nicotianae]|uniref:Uncharacterized protein n=1 Tax=Phytophthora nicotianae TaxID=4792 RepID=W2FTS9_PHYNI|nr:hypothetical protein L915_19634 [Phytophthora nicotianae]